MVIKIVTHKNKKLLTKRSRQIVDIYNTHYNCAEKFQMKYPKNCTIAYVDGIKGGIQCETFGDTFSIVYFAGFEEKDRNKGHARRCIKALKTHLNLVGVQIDIFNKREPWQALGFTTESMLNLVPLLLDISQDEFLKLNEKGGGKHSEDGLSLEDIQGIMSM